MNKYEIIIYWSKTDDCYVAEVPELGGCLAHGYTENEALENIKSAIDLWLETAKEFGDEIPQPKERKLVYA